MHSLRSAAVQYTNYGTGGAFELPTQSGTLITKTISKLMDQDQDDIKAYPVMLERLMEAYEVPKAHWEYKIATQLKGWVQKACAMMLSEVFGDYNEVKTSKDSYFKSIHITEETYWLRLRGASRK